MYKVKLMLLAHKWQRSHAYAEDIIKVGPPDWISNAFRPVRRAAVHFRSDSQEVGLCQVWNGIFECVVMVSNQQ